MSERELNSSSKFNKIKPSAALASVLAATALLSACGEKVSGEPTETKTVTATAEPTPTTETTTQPVEVSQDLSPEAIDGKHPSGIYANTLVLPEQSYSANKLLHEATPELASDDYDKWRDLVTSPIVLSDQEMENDKSIGLAIANNIDARILATMNAGRTAEDVKDCTDFFNSTCAEDIRNDYELIPILKEIGVIPEADDGTNSKLIDFYDAVEMKYVVRNSKDYNCDDETDTCRVFSEILDGKYAKELGEPNFKVETDQAGGVNLEYKNILADSGMINEVSAFRSGQTLVLSDVNIKSVVNKSTGEVNIDSINYSPRTIYNEVVFQYSLAVFTK